MAQEKHFKYLGKPRKLVEGAEKVTGHVRYTADLTLPGMLHARPILSPYAHAKILAVDTAEAESMPGVVAVLTAGDLPTKGKVIASRNSAVLAKGKVLFRGQPVAVVVGESEAAAQDAAEMVFVDYEPLPAVIDVLDAIQPDAPVIWPEGLPSEESDLSSAHANVDKAGDSTNERPPNVFATNHYERGDVEEGFAAADVVVEHTYRTEMVHQGYLEPHACVAESDPLGRSITFYTGTQGSFLVRDEVAGLLSLPTSKVRIVPMTLGGGFGAKYGILEPLTGAVALALKRPVRLILTRSEDFLATTPAHGVIVELKLGAKRDGRLAALQARIIMDNGVFSFAMGGIAATLLGGYYKFPHLKIDVYEVNTNKPQAGAYRAPGSPQATFAIESAMDELARRLGLDPLEFRYQNAVEGGDPSGNGSPWPPIGLKQCLQRARAHPLWQNRDALAPHEGLGIAVGGWPAFMGPSAAVCQVDDDGTVTLQLGSIDISGVNSSFVLIAAEVLGVSPDQVQVIQGDTQTGPYSPNSGGSQVTYSVAGAIARASEEAKRKLLEIASDEFEASADDIELVDGRAQVKGVPDRTLPLGELVRISRSQAGGVGPIIGEGNAAVPENAPGFVVHLARVTVDPETGDVRPIEYVAVQDVGFALNPLMVEGQMQGGAVQSISFGLYEALVYDEDGQLLSGSFMDYTLPRIDNVPVVESIMVENPSPHGPFGARGIGEPPITAGPAALANAIRAAAGVRLTRLPLRPEAVWRAMQANE